MQHDLPVTDEEWKILRQSSFSVENFLKSLELFDSIRHIAGNSDFSAKVCRDMQKLKELVRNVFMDECRDCIGELFFESSCMEDLMSDMEDWILHVRRALTSLNKLRPEGLPVPDSDTKK
jgi:hypothetical protein